ncbi:MAG: NAD(P)/FAD-dependent oxidoreductase [Clostridia bacterium]
MSRVLVIGGGAAGLMAGIFAARAGAKAIVLERNEKLGKKLYLTGKGRCNVTNAASLDQFMKMIPRNPRFLYAALNFFFNEDLMQLLTEEGVPVKVERGERVYPASDHASDVTRALEQALRRAGGQVMLGTRVAALERAQDGRCVGVQLEGGRILAADAVIVATGGLSYPTTGSTGDGYGFAEQAGLMIVPTRPSLTGIETVESWPWGLSGLTLKNVALHAVRGKKKIFAQQGELLLTHFGLSGPLALSLSGTLPDDYVGQKLTLDLKPALERATLEARLLRDFKEMSRKQLITVMDGLAPHNLALALLDLAGLRPDTPVNAVTTAQRAQLIDVLKGAAVTIKGLRGYAEAVITRGGVCVKQVSASTLEAKSVPGLYFAGEVLDIDAMTGGYNLQLAFSTGALAGDCAARASNE